MHYWVTLLLCTLCMHTLYRLKLLKQFLQFLTLLNMAFSFLRIFYCNFLHDMRLVERVRLPSFSSKTDPDFASYARKCHDGWLQWNASINLKRLWRQSTARTRLGHGLGLHGSMKSFVRSVWAQGSGAMRREPTGDGCVNACGDWWFLKARRWWLSTSRMERSFDI